MQTLVKTKPKPTQTYKYTVEYVKAELVDMIQALMEDETIKTKAQLFKVRSYSPSWFYRYTAKYGDNKRMQELLKKIDNILEARLLEQGLTGKNFPFVIFLLKNHYDYQDKREVETGVTHTFKVTRGAVTPKQARKVLNTIAPNKEDVAQ